MCQRDPEMLVSMKTRCQHFENFKITLTTQLHDGEYLEQSIQEGTE